MPDLPGLIRELAELEFTTLQGVTNCASVLIIVVIGAYRLKAESAYTYALALLLLLAGAILLLLGCMTMVGYLNGENLASDRPVHFEQHIRPPLD